MTRTPETQDTTPRTGWERTVTPKPAAGPNLFLLGGIDGHNARPIRSRDSWYLLGYIEGVAVFLAELKAREAARPGGQ